MGLAMEGGATVDCDVGFRRASHFYARGFCLTRTPGVGFSLQPSPLWGISSARHPLTAVARLRNKLQGAYFGCRGPIALVSTSPQVRFGSRPWVCIWQVVDSHKIGRLRFACHEPEWRGSAVVCC
jgi:hypothetical protein